MSEGFINVHRKLSDPIIGEGVEHIILEMRDMRDMVNGCKILVTGGAGFIGSWLCDVLVSLNAYVVCIDNLYTGKLDNIHHIMEDENFRFINADINKFRFDDKFDFIIHCASIPSPDKYMSNPVETMLPNSIGLLTLLENARENDSILMFTSTSEVYGDASIIPTPENYYGYVNPIGLRSCYDESKRFGEALCMAYFREYGVDVRIARIFNTYGPRLDVEARYARVIPKFIIQALKNEPITIHGDGKQTRSFTYITDTITALIKMLLNEKAKGEVINVGNPHEISIIELANIIRNLTNSSSKIVFTEPRPDDPKRRCPDISKAKKLLNWEPKIPLEEGLKYTIDWFRRYI